MKKLFSSIFLLLILLLVFWALTGWYLGASAERSFKSIIQENSQIAGEKMLRADLLSYRKTLMGAKASLRVSSDMPFLSERLGEFQVDVRLLNGPVFITKSGISIGSSRWFLRIDETSLTEEEVENLKSFFPISLPTAIIRLDFEQKTHYLARVRTSTAQSLITGVFDLDTQDNRGAITLDNFRIGLPPNQMVEEVTATKVNISYQHQKAITAAYKPGTTSIQIPSLQLKLHGLKSPIEIRANLRSNISSKNNYLNGFINIELEQSDTKEIPVDSAKLSLLFKGISADGFIAFSEARAEFDNLQQQAGWVLDEAGEFPEGQDQIWQLYDRIEAASRELPDILLKKTLNADSLIQLESELKTRKGISRMNGELKIVKQTTVLADSKDESENQIKSSKKRGGVLRHASKSVSTGSPATLFNTFISLLEGEAKVTLDDEFYLLLAKFNLVDKQEFKLILKDNKLLIKSISLY